MVSDLEGSVRLPHSDERDPFRALRFLVPSRLEGRWGVVDRKAGGLADARHILDLFPKEQIAELADYNKQIKGNHQNTKTELFKWV